MNFKKCMKFLVKEEEAVFFLLLINGPVNVNVLMMVCVCVCLCGLVNK